jgi:hypothetical protein
MAEHRLVGYLDKGFVEPPRRCKAEGTETLHRIFGGECSIVGNYFHLEDPATVSSAEFDTALVKWGGPSLYVARFRVGAGTPLYIGRVDWNGPRCPRATGLHPVGNRAAAQVWIDLRHVLTRLTLVGRPCTLLQARAPDHRGRED